MIGQAYQKSAGQSTLPYIDAKSSFVSALLDKIPRNAGSAKYEYSSVSLATLAAYINKHSKTPLPNLPGELKRTILLYANEVSQAAALINNIPANVTNGITTIKANWSFSGPAKTGTIQMQTGLLVLWKEQVFPATFVPRNYYNNFLKYW